jgi:glycosyltransferase involved in cell wall biosynthesis
MLKVGLVGWGASTGNGGMNFDIARLCPWISKWLCPEHPELGWHEPYIKPISDKVIHCNCLDDTEHYNQFLEGLDAILFIEHTYLRGYDLIGECKKRGIFTVCIPMWEWWPERKPWSLQTDMVWCVTKYTRSYMECLAEYLKYRCDDCSWSKRIYGNYWGIELDDFQFSQRTEVKRFLFVNGNGGGKGLRKGSEVLAAAAAYIPEIEILMLTQNDNYVRPMPENIKVICQNFPTKMEVYQNGDVFLAPSHWEGLGHQLYEAQACGLPVITTDAPPMNECGADWLIPVSQVEPYMLSGKQIPKVTADARQLSKILRSIYGLNITQQSQTSRSRVETQHNLKTVLEDLREAIEQGMQVSSTPGFINSFPVSIPMPMTQENWQRLQYQQMIRENYGESQIEYRILVWDAWFAYQQGNFEPMFEYLKLSFQYRPFLKIETVADWIETFDKLSSTTEKTFKIDLLTSLSEWKKLTQDIYTKNNLV